MKYLVILILLFFSYLPAVVGEFEYIKSPWDKFAPIKSIKFDNVGDIYLFTLGDSIYKYDIVTNKYTHYSFDNSNGLNTVRAIGIGPDGNVIILSMNEAFYFKDNTWISLKEKIGDYAISDWSSSHIYKDFSGNLYFGVDKLIKYSKDSFSVIKQDNWGFKKFFYYEDELLFIDNYMVFADNYFKDNIYFLDPDNPSKSLIYNLKNTVKPDTAFISKIQNIGKEIFMLLDHKDKTPPNSFKDFYVLLDGIVRKLEIEYLKQFESYYIRDFITTKNSELLIAIDIFDPNLKESHSELVYVDRTGKLIKSYAIPKFKSENPNSSFGKEYFPLFISNMTESFGSVYMISYFNYWDGIFKFTPTHVDIEDEKNSIVPGSNIWIFDTYPNPSSIGSLTAKIFCLPEYINNIKVEISDIMGVQCLDCSYELLNYSQFDARGQIKVHFKNLSKGVKILSIKAGGEIYAKCFIVI